MNRTLKFALLAIAVGLLLVSAECLMLQWEIDRLVHDQIKTLTLLRDNQAAQNRFNEAVTAKLRGAQ